MIALTVILIMAYLIVSIGWAITMTISHQKDFKNNSTIAIVFIIFITSVVLMPVFFLLSMGNAIAKISFYEED